MTAKPLLSILIPAYAYKEGVLRILDALPLGSPDVEVIVHDDSPGPEIEIEMAQERFSPVIYQRNVPPHGAVANWNGLIEAANGRYIMLVHHDEYPAHSDFAERALHALKDEPELDILLFGLRLRRKGVGFPIRLIPDALRIWLLIKAPGYLLRRNFIGPTACLLIRRSIAPRFDPDLVWLVDVDFYLKAIKRASMVKRGRAISIISETYRAGSITRSLSAELGEIASRERKTLIQRHEDVKVAKPLRGLGPIEPLLWAFARLIGLLPVPGNHSME